MTQLATLSEHLRVIERRYRRAQFWRLLLEVEHDASAEEIAQRLGEIESALEEIQDHTTCAKVIAHELASRSRAVTVCHTRGELITECAPATSPSGR